MKKSVLFIASLAMSIAAFAQWTKPTYSGGYVDMSDDGATTQFLYNAEAGGFLCGHNDWNTRASVDALGDSIRMVARDGGTWNIRLYPAAYATKNAWLYVACNSFDAQWVDAGNAVGSDQYPGTDQWVITKNDDGSYSISNKTVDVEPGTWGISETVKGKTGDTRLYIKDATQHYEEDVDGEAVDMGLFFEGAFYDKWHFVSVAAYEAYSEQIATYNAALSLKKAIDEALEKYPALDLSAQTAVYNNTASTKAELAAAEASISGAIIEMFKEQASVANPIDFTMFITNPTFDKVGDFSGWSSGFGAGGDTYSNAEVYGKTFDVYQDITAALPGGVYIVACNGYTRYQNAQADYDQWAAGTPSETKIYLKGKTYGQFFTPVKHVSEGGSYTSLAADMPDYVKGADKEATATTPEGTLYTPNYMTSANYYFKETEDPKRYYNEALGGIAEGDTLRIGVFNNKATGSDWSIFDDFQLFYLGDKLEAYQMWAQTVKEKNATLTFDNVYYGKPEKDLYDATVAALENGTTKEEIAAAILNVNAVIDSVDVSKTNYAAYVQTLKDVAAWVAEFNGDGEDLWKLSDYLEADEAGDWDFPHGTAKQILDYANDVYEGTLSAAEIVAEAAYVLELQATALRNSLVDGTDLTVLIANPGFEEAGGKGWKLDTSKGGTDNLTNWHGGNATNYAAEAFQQNFDVYQIIDNVPDGLYEVSVQAFYRTGTNDVAYAAYEADPEMIGDAKVYPEVYLNDFATKVRNVMEIQFENGELDANNTNMYKTAGDTYTLDGMVSASNAFSLTDPEKNFTMSAYGLVTDGKIRLGIRKLEGPTTGNVWTLWDNFKLTYRAKNADALASVIKHYVALANTLDANTYGAPDSDALGKAVETAKDAKDADAMYDALITLVSAYNTALASISAYEQLEEAATNLEVALDEYAETASDKAMQAALDLMNGEVAEAMAYELPGAEIAALIEKINEAIVALKVPGGYEDASDDNPFPMTDVIVNPSFEDGVTGWSGTGLAHNATVYNAEHYNKTYDTYQDLSGLPAGMYEVAVSGFYRQGTSKGDYDATVAGTTVAHYNAYIYAIGENADSCKAPIMSCSTGALPVTSNSLPYDGDVKELAAVGEGEAYYIPNTMASGNAWMEEGYYTPTDEYNSVLVKVGEDGKLRIGVKKDVLITNDWSLFDDFTLTYYGADSKKVPTDIEGVATASGSGAVKAIYTITGMPVETLQKGVNIVIYEDGSKAKVFVK